MTKRPPSAHSLARARRARDVGIRAERAVADYLVAHGYEVLGLNVRAGRLEIDVLARKGEVIVVVEVRTRAATAWERPLDSIGWEKRRRIRRAGERLWNARFAKDATAERMRFDCASVTFGESGEISVEHVPAAF